MKDILQIIIVVVVCFTVGLIFGYEARHEPVKCTGLQIIDCGHIVHNGDTVRFTTLPVK